MITLKSFVSGQWREGDGEGAVLVNPSTGEPMARTSTEGLDFGGAVAYAREKGGPNLRAMHFAVRADLLKAMSKALHEKRDELLDLAMRNGGNTRGDAKFDVDGATGTLSAYAMLGKGLGETKLMLDGTGVQLGRSPRWWGQHVRLPKEGVAVLVNAFNFPAWGWAEKAACALLAGVPVIVKPATSTSLVTFRMIEILDEAGVMPEGAVQLVCGSAGDLLSHLRSQDVLAFTGSADTALTLRSRDDILRSGVTVNVEADSLNSAVLAPGLGETSDTYRLFVKDVLRETTQKTGQKCTAVRRILVPADDLDRVQADLVHGLESTKVGDTANSEVRMGPVTTEAQLADVREGIGKLAAAGEIVTGGPEPFDAIDAPAGTGFFVKPTLVRVTDPRAADVAHTHEVFGPVASIMPYDGTAADAADLVKRGDGSLVASAYGDDPAWLGAVIETFGAWNGRLYLGSAKVADMAGGSGMALPWLNHGGPGRAGNGEELGGLAGLRLYQRRTAIQGDRGILSRLLPRPDAE